LNEGFATFLGTATVAPKAGRLGQPNSSELYVLSQSKLLPLDVLFKADSRSPYYNEANKVNIFYAESWALVHYLMLDPVKKQGNPLGKYLNLVENGGDPLESARAAFGDLGQLEKELQGYIARTSYKEAVVALPETTSSETYNARTLSPAESKARLGDFDVYRGQLDEARPKIEEAIRLDPTLAGPQESMGLLLFRQEKRDEAQKYFSRAVALDSKSALANFYDGMLLLSGGADEKETVEAQEALEKAVALNPQFAPAWDNLAMLYSRDPAKLDKALSATRTAVNEMPGEPRYRFDMAIVLLRMGRFDDARTIAQTIATSSNPLVASRAGQLVEEIDRAKQFRSGDRKREESIVTSDTSSNVQDTETPDDNPPPPVLKRRTGQAPDSSDTSALSESRGPSKTSATPAAKSSIRFYERTGTIERIDCGDTPEVTITLREMNLVLRLHSADLSQITISSGAPNSSGTTVSCAEFNGKSVRILYQPVVGKSWDGEIMSIQILQAR
jgi:tetratricopeptide (TPR) repeat protein